MKQFNFFIKKKEPKKTIIYDTFWKFAAERQNIFYSRIIKSSFPWTMDSILAKYKFTNVYRATDRVSQFLIKKIIYDRGHDFQDLFFRIIIYKIFNKIETWELLKEKLGTVDFKNYTFEKYNEILLKAFTSGKTLYSSAYIMPSPKYGYKYKFQNHLKLIENMMKDDLYLKLSEQKNFYNVFNLLKQYQSIGDFLAYQYSIDLNYSSLINFSENDFVIPGPGAINGIKKCFCDYGDFNESDLIKYVTNKQEEEFERLGLNFKNLWGRNLHLIDIQNVFCEVDKYSRMTHPEFNQLTSRKRIKQYFKPKSLKIIFFFPPKWKINERIVNEI